MRHWASIIAGLAIGGAASADVSVWPFARPLANGSLWMSSDARVIVFDRFRLIDFVRVDVPLSMLGLPYTYPAYAFRPSGSGEVLSFRTVPSSGYFGWIYTDGPPTATPLLEVTDECGRLPINSGAPHLSSDGSVAAYNLYYYGTMGNCGGPGSGGRSCAVIWNRSTGTTRMIMPPEFPGVDPGPAATANPTRVAGISDDGDKVAVNHSFVHSTNDSTGAIISLSTGAFEFPFDVPGEYYAAWIGGMSRDGQAVYGTVQIDPGPSSGTTKPVLKVGDGPVVRLDLSMQAQGYSFEQLFDISNNGTVVGDVADGSVRSAAVWDAQGNVQLLDDILIPANPAGLCGWRFLTAEAISSDGSTIVGTARDHLNRLVNYVARLSGDPLPPSSMLRTFGDTNGDNAVDGADLSALLSSFGSTVTPGAMGDLNCDGLVNAADLSVLLSNFRS